ncbi:uncharacterized protein KY384_006245 [Bacidia gigantensis]|uniref:uncharacterized protein n=1 Tax=Bacidia gigantensis TaxID=2732470 RepID=UPI001D05BFF8|nr:uncharacterized protein KY384_006245 [Bacidia gigantensis]KAG8529608.1 hypothetical protein KY384_006245 [Bacidia gigantensis]
MSQLPLKLRVQLRDHWENPASPAKASIAALKELLGLEIEISFPVANIWDQVKTSFPEQDVFVPTVIGVIQQWTNALKRRLEDEGGSWTDKLLEEFDGKSMHAFVDVFPLGRPTTILSKSTSPPTLQIQIPDSKPPYAPPNFEDDFDNFFESRRLTTAMPQQAPIASKMATRTAAVTSSPPRSLPALDTLARPDILFGSLVPYHMIIDLRSDRLSIQGSHQPSLDLLFRYLKKHIGGNPDTAEKIPLLKVELHRSNFGYGNLQDRMSIERHSEHFKWIELSPVLPIAFIEGVLGYRHVEKQGGSVQWYFKREQPFAS